jgi:cytochrome c biogenesis protein CcdA
MSGQLFSGLGLAAAATGAAVAGVSWLAAAAIIAAIPFLFAGVLLAVAVVRDRRRPPARVISLVAARR